MPVDRYRARHAARRASRRGSEEFRDSFSSSEHVTEAARLKGSVPHRHCVAPFEREEISLGRKIGTGSFSDVYEIKAFHLEGTVGCYTPEEQRKRAAMARDDTDSKYVLKRLQRGMETSKLFAAAAYDISHEAEMLSALDHPNIVKIHGICARGHDAFLDGCEGYFLILERLDTTLDKQVSLWAKSRKTLNPAKMLKRKLVGGGRVADVPSINARLDMAASLASALEYLHGNGLVYRDLKPGNVGFDSSGNVRLLDFGLARVLPSSKAVNNDVFKMSIAGSPRYSSPEVLFQHPYGKGHDVWSFSLVLWELLSLQRPFAEHKDFEHLVAAVVLKEERPRLCATWPRPIKDLFGKSLSTEHTKRPSMSEIRTTLEETVMVQYHARSA
ncbi:hypothetical protein ACHAXT_007420 [Thalassiosira profunda]